MLLIVYQQIEDLLFRIIMKRKRIGVYGKAVFFVIPFCQTRIECQPGVIGAVQGHVQDRMLSKGYGLRIDEISISRVVDGEPAVLATDEKPSRPVG